MCSSDLLGYFGEMEGNLEQHWIEAQPISIADSQSVDLYVSPSNASVLVVTFANGADRLYRVEFDFNKDIITIFDARTNEPFAMRPNVGIKNSIDQASLYSLKYTKDTLEGIWALGQNDEVLEFAYFISLIWMCFRK